VFFDITIRQYFTVARITKLFPKNIFENIVVYIKYNNIHKNFEFSQIIFLYYLQQKNENIVILYSNI